MVERWFYDNEQWLTREIINNIGCLAQKNAIAFGIVAWHYPQNWYSFSTLGDFFWDLRVRQTQYGDLWIPNISKSDPSKHLTVVARPFKYFEPQIFGMWVSPALFASLIKVMCFLFPGGWCASSSISLRRMWGWPVNPLLPLRPSSYQNSTNLNTAKKNTCHRYVHTQQWLCYDSGPW